jgi:hypothetical protein
VIPITANSTKPQASKRLIRLFERLSDHDRKTLLDFAEFLAARADDKPHDIPEPKPISRPAQESVVKAVQRLSASYFMLDKAEMLHETSNLMAQHIIQGRATSEVIDELEVIFNKHYQKLRDRQS